MLIYTNKSKNNNLLLFFLIWCSKITEMLQNTVLKDFYTIEIKKDEFNNLDRSQFVKIQI